MTESTLTIRLPAALKDDFLTAAKSNDRTAAQLLRDFMRNYVSPRDYWADLEKQVRQAEAEIERGEGMDGDEVERLFAEKRKMASRTVRKAA